jgi:LacI family transcriptional regulator
LRHGQKEHENGRPRVGVVCDCTDTYGRAILRGVARYANLQRRWLLFKDLKNAFDAHRQWKDLDGGIFAGMPAKEFDQARKRCRHAVNCGGGGDPALSPVIALDDIAAGKQAADHLLNCGLEHFAFYGFQPDYRTATNRLHGFRQTVESRGFTCNVCPIERPTQRQRITHSHRPKLIAWLGDLPRPVGIMAVDDTNAADLAEACLEAGMPVPDHVAIVGVNDDDLLCDSSWPPLSSVNADYNRIGYTAAVTLDRLMMGESLPTEQRLILLPPLGVTQRQSTNTLAVKDQNLVDALRYIREHGCDPCSVTDVLRHIPVGRRWLERQFATQLGRTPHEEIERVRIETAQRLLRRTDLNMWEIASRCGFQELKTFYLAFGRVAKVTPAVYRRSALFGGK